MPLSEWTKTAPAIDTFTFGGSTSASPGTATYLLTTWSTGASVVKGTVRRTAGGLVIKYTGPGTTGANAPTQAGTGTDGNAPYVAYLGTQFSGILIEDADASNSMNCGIGLQVTTSGDLAGAYVGSSGAGLTWPLGTDVTQIAVVATNASVNYTVALTV